MKRKSSLYLVRGEQSTWSSLSENLKNGITEGLNELP